MGASPLLTVIVLADFRVLVVIVLAVVVAGTAVLTPPRSRDAGAGSPCDSASSRQRVSIKPLRDAMCCYSEAIIAYSAVGGGGGGRRDHRPPYGPWSETGCVPSPRR